MQVDLFKEKGHTVFIMFHFDPTQSIVTVSPQGYQRLHTLLNKAPDGTLGIRLGIKTQGCSGHTYDISYAKEHKRGDEVIPIDDITLYVDADAVMFVLGTEIHWHEDFLNANFVFNNPNEAGRCGCGSSFHLENEAQPQKQ